MKTHFNNRSDKIGLVESLCFKDLENLGDKYTLNKNVRKVARYYSQMKEHRSGSEITFSGKGAQALTDSYEKALAAMNLYTYSNNIKNDIGYVYVITSDTYEGFYKIGCSKDAEKRLNSYQTGSPFRDYFIEKYAVVEDYRACEDMFLDSFKGYSCGGEWVEMDKEGLQNQFKVAADVLADNGFYTRFCTRSKYKDKIFDDMGWEINP